MTVAQAAAVVNRNPEAVRKAVENHGIRDRRIRALLAERMEGGASDKLDRLLAALIAKARRRRNGRDGSADDGSRSPAMASAPSSRGCRRRASTSS